MKINLYSRTPCQFYDTVSNLDFCDFCEQGKRSRCSQNSGNLVYLQYSRKTLYYFEFLNSLPVSERLIYLCLNPFDIPKFSLHLCVLPRQILFTFLFVKQTSFCSACILFLYLFCFTFCICFNFSCLLDSKALQLN